MYKHIYTPMMKARTIQTIESLVDELGGPSAVGELFGIVPSAVCNWDEKGVIPRGWHLPLIIELKRRRLRYDPTLFGLSPEQARILTKPEPRVVRG